MKCVKCGSDNPVTSKFCGNCAAQLYAEIGTGEKSLPGLATDSNKETTPSTKPCDFDTNNDIFPDGHPLHVKKKTIPGWVKGLCVALLLALAVPVIIYAYGQHSIKNAANFQQDLHALVDAKAGELTSKYGPFKTEYDSYSGQLIKYFSVDITYANGPMNEAEAERFGRELFDALYALYLDYGIDIIEKDDDIGLQIWVRAMQKKQISSEKEKHTYGVCKYSQKEGKIIWRVD